MAIIHVASLFNQLLPHFPRTEFGALVKENDAERGAKGFGCWTQLRRDRIPPGLQIPCKFPTRSVPPPGRAPCDPTSEEQTDFIAVKP
jgi:hypothetical protein